LTGITLQFIILPFLGFVVVKVLQLDAPMGITLLVVTSSPGGSYSNW
jgi:predicted Na+-dependent transporter